jgi:ribosomal 30S subunit maturation factor RimM
VHANPDDMGRLIGRRGRVIQAMRQLTRAAGAAEGVRATVDVAGARATDADEAPSRLEIGRVGSHGLRGRVTVMLVTDAETDGSGTVLHADDRELVVEAARPLRDGWVVRFAGVTTRWRRVAQSGAAPSRGGCRRLWAHDLVGCAVVGATRGSAVTAVQATHGCRADSGVLVPCLRRRPRLMRRVALPEGLLDL